MKEVVVFIILISFFTIVLSLGYFFSRNFNIKRFIGVDESSQYQAVALVNGQTFFGKIQDRTVDPLILNDVFYVKRKPTPILSPTPIPTPVPTEKKESTTSAQITKAPTFIPLPTLSSISSANELVKLEYGDKKRDFVKIKRKLILYIQDLRADSKVLELIKQYHQAKTKGSESPVKTSDKVEVSAE